MTFAYKLNWVCIIHHLQFAFKICFLFFLTDYFNNYFFQHKWWKYQIEPFFFFLPDDIAQKFGLTPEQFGENLRDNYQRHEVDQYPGEPSELAKELICGWVDIFTLLQIAYHSTQLFWPTINEYIGYEEDY